MKTYFFSSILIISILFVSGCKRDEGANSTATPNTSSAKNEILLLGDSRVEGARPQFESYRYSLWKILLDNSYSFDFIGKRTDNAQYPNYLGQSFDTDHQSEGGSVTNTVLEALKNEATGLTPDIVLLGIGGNDLNDKVNTVQQTLSNIELIIDKVRTLNPNVTIFLEQIAPARSDFMSQELADSLKAFNSKIPQIATSKNTNQSSIIIVDMSTGWMDSYMADPLHYNEAGAAIVAKRYYDAMKSYLVN